LQRKGTVNITLNTPHSTDKNCLLHIHMKSGVYCASCTCF